MTHPLADMVIDTVADNRTEPRRLRIVASERHDGDVHPDNVALADLEARQRAVSGQTWSMLDQVHGVSVHEASASDASNPAVGDLLYTSDLDTHIAVWAADCAPLVLAADDGTVVAAHCGWRGLAAGAVDTAVGVAQQRGGSVVAAVLGPVIGPCCYEFGAGDLATIPDAVASRTAGGSAALDVAATIAATLGRHDIELDAIGACTGCDDRWFSHRVRAEPGRHAVVAWWESVQ